MTIKARLAIEMSEKRQKLNELLALDELTDGAARRNGDVDGKAPGARTRTKGRDRGRGSYRGRAPKAPAKGPSFAPWPSRCNMGAIFAAVLEHRNVEGPERRAPDPLRPGRAIMIPRRPAPWSIGP